MTSKSNSKRRWAPLWSLTVASTKMYFRNASAVFFTLFLPLVFIAVFGLLSKSTGASLSIDLTNQSTTPLAVSFVKTLNGVSAFKVTETTAADGRDKLGKGKVDLQLIIPASFGTTDNTGHLTAVPIQTYYNKGKPQNGQTANLILGQIIAGLNDKLTGAPQLVTLSSTGVQTNNLGSIDFILPGILAMSIMQLGIFSVAFGFISFKTSGALRRLQATPIRPTNFIIAQSVTRLLIGILQVSVLTVLGIWLFGFHMLGNVVLFMFFAMLGTLVFLAIGFSIAGWAKDENQAAPVANIIQLPMLFLSGTFFPRDAFPSWLKTVTDYFPLTYLADALRRIANEGAHLSALSGDLLGLLVWGAIVFIISVRLFKWE